MLGERIACERTFQRCAAHSGSPVRRCEWPAQCSTSLHVGRSKAAPQRRDRLAAMRCRTTWIVAMAAFAGATLAATVTEPLTLRQLAAGAALIVRGSVTDVRAFVVPGRGIESVATVAVEHTIKGESEPFLAVRVP